MSEPSAEPVLPEPARAIIAELSGFDGLPRDALRAAAENWDAVLPSFLEMLEGYVREPRPADVGRCDALFFIIHLFGQMREERAYPLLMRFLSMDPDDVRAVLGDSVTETLPRLAISMFDGDPGPLETIVKDKDADEFVRSGLLEALAFLTREGRVELEHTKSFLRECDGDLEPRDGSFVWVGWQDAISYLGLSEFRDMVRKAFKDGRIEPSFMSFHHFEEDLRAVAEPESGATHPDGERLGYFGDAVEEFSSWYGFSEAYREEREKAARRRIAEALDPEKPEDRGAPRPEGLDMTLPSEPRVNPLRHVGRNDPCPCGSGKKFKKCCLK